jgi:drug/metabolite transporter (DMT)-like permease
MSNSRADALQYTGGSLILLATAIMWGVQFPVAKSAFESVDAFHAAVYRFGIAAMILMVVLLAIEGRAAFRLNAEGVKVWLAGVLGMCGAPTLIFGGLMLTRPEIAAIIVATQPIMAVLVQRLAGGELPGWRTSTCVALAFIGVVTVVTEWNLELLRSPIELWGNLMVLAGALCWVLYTFACSRYTQWSNLRLTTWSMMSGLLGNILVVVVLVSLGVVTHPSPDDWYQARYELTFLTYIGVLMGMFAWTAGSRRVGALNAMLFTNLIPVSTFAVRYAQGYRFSWLELAGAVMVIGALLAQNLVLRWRLKQSAA